MVRQMLAQARIIPDSKARRRALGEVVDEIIKAFETWAPTEWEAHFLLHAIRHIEDGFPAVAAEEIASVMKPRHQQTTVDVALSRSRAAWRSDHRRAPLGQSCRVVL
ncbi:MAG TPA: hypothetical protein VN809_14665 [Telmatospirillum sp.]|nr:hypothetical protein [Telmatospirillum sp.]